jgi:hypothetical protein
VFITVPCGGACTSYKVTLGIDTAINSLTLGDTSSSQFLDIYSHSLTMNKASIINVNGQITGNEFILSMFGSNALTVNGILYIFNSNVINAPIDLSGQIVVNGYYNVINGNVTTHSTSHIAIIGVTGGSEPVDAGLEFMTNLTNYGLIELGTNVAGPTAWLIAPGVTNASTGIIRGEGILQKTGEGGGGTIINGGTVNPGAPIGLLTINDNYVQQASGILNIEIGGTTAGTQYDKLTVNGQAD